MTEFVSPARVALNIIRYIGDEVSKIKRPINELHAGVMANEIGAPSRQIAESVTVQLYENGLVRMSEPPAGPGWMGFFNVELSLDGWAEYEAEKRGKRSENYGFIALQFDEPELEELVEFLKEQISQKIGYALFHMRDRGVERPGIIDNNMRVQIRDSAFVIADLTHDNRGAYWEAGYAEGLGKPVVYICEEKKFKEEVPHFDVNHCTTIMWTTAGRQEFADRLINTLRVDLESE